MKRVLLALTVAALGLGLAYIVAHHPEAARAPVPVLYGLSVILVLGGVAIAVFSGRHRGPYRWVVSGALGCATAGAAWFAFGPGDRLCTRSRSAVLLSEFECRSGAVVVMAWLLVLFVAVVRRALASRHAA